MAIQRNFIHMDKKKRKIRNSTTQNILTRFRLDIILCKYEDNEPVREIALAERYGVSRAAVRNALFILEHEGMVISLPNGTKKLRRFSLNDLNDLYELRTYLENKAIEQIFNRPNRNFSMLLNAMNHLSLSVKENIDSILDADAAFHREAIAISENRSITQAWDMMSGIFNAIFHLNMTESPSYMEWYIETAEERHKRLLAALLTEEAKSKELFSGHIHDAMEVSVKALSGILNS